MTSDWPLARLGDVVDIVNGRNQRAVESVSGHYPIYGSGGVIGRATAFLCEAGTTVIGRKGSINNPIYVESRFWNVDTAFGLSPRPGLASGFLHRFCQHYDFTRHNKGTTLPSLVKTDLLEIRIPYPPLSEQQRIVGILDEALESVATAETHAEKNLQNVRALLESGLNAAVTGALTRDWRRGNPSVGSARQALRQKLSQQSGQARSRGARPPVADRPIMIPDSWVLASPEQLSTHVVDCPHSTPKWTESGVACLRTTNFKAGCLDLESLRFVSEETYKERISRLEPAPGDVLFSREGGILGIACIMPPRLRACLGQRIMQFRLDTGVVLPEFFVGVLNSALILSEVRRLVGGAAAPHLNIRDIKTFPIPLPPIAEQRRIVELLVGITSQTQRLESVYRRKLAALEDLKKSLLHQAFAGQLGTHAA